MVKRIVSSPVLDGERHNRISKSYWWGLLPRLVCFFAAGVLLTKLTALGVGYIDKKYTEVVRSNSSHVKFEVLHNDCLVISVTASSLLKVSCGGNIEINALPLDFRTVEGVAYETASSEMYRGLVQAVDRLGVDNLSCRYGRILDLAALSEHVGVVCKTPSVNLAGVLVAQGHAEPAPEPILNGLYTDKESSIALHKAETYAQVYNIGLQGEASNIRKSFRANAQAWIATLLGFVGAMAAFLSRARGESDVLNFRVRWLLKEGARELNALIYEKKSDSKPFENHLNELEMELSVYSNDDELDSHFQSLRKVSERIARNISEGEVVNKAAELKVAKSDWDALSTFWQSKRG